MNFMFWDVQLDSSNFRLNIFATQKFIIQLPIEEMIE